MHFTVFEFIDDKAPGYNEAIHQLRVDLEAKLYLAESLGAV